MATINLGNIKFNWKGTYNAGTAYALDDVVSYNGSSYVCIQASTNNLPTVTAYWNIMSSAGTNGTDLTTTLSTQGDLVYRDGSGLQRLGAGTSGQVLQTGGAGANPSWGTVSSDFVKIKTIDASDVSSVSMVHGSNNVVFDGTYAQYHLKVMDYYHNQSSAELQIRITTDGSNYISSGYNQQRWRTLYSTNTMSTDNQTDTIWKWMFGGDSSNANQTRQQADIWFSNPQINAYPDCRGFFWGAETNQALPGLARGRYQTQTTYTGFQLTQTNGNNFSGKFVLYGIKG
jgi:hypothetical protein